MDDGDLQGDESDYYTLEELQQMEDPTMATLAVKFSHIRFRRKSGYRSSGSSSILQRAGSSSYGSGKVYKIGMVDRSKFWCYNYEKMGHFSSEYRESKQADERKAFQRNDSSSKKKYHVKSYIAEGKSWDDTDDEEKEHMNLTLMAQGDYNPNYGYEVHKMPYDMDKRFKCHTKDCVKYVIKTDLKISGLDRRLGYAQDHEKAAKDETEKAKVELSKVQARNDELEITNTQIENLKQRNEYLEKKFLVCVETATEIKNKIIELDNKLYAFQNSANLAK